MGAAIAASIGVGLYTLETIPFRATTHSVPCILSDSGLFVFLFMIAYILRSLTLTQEREAKRGQWRRAVDRSLDWAPLARARAGSFSRLAALAALSFLTGTLVGSLLRRR